MSATEDSPKFESPSRDIDEFRGPEGEEEKEYERERRFDPAADPELHNIPHQSLIKFDPETQRSNLTRKYSETGETKVDPTTVIIHLASGYKVFGNGEYTLISWALYFGPYSRLNKSDGQVCRDYMTEREAEQFCLEWALENIYESISTTVRQLIIATDSPSLVEFVTADLPKMARKKDFKDPDRDYPYSLWEALNLDQVDHHNDDRPVDLRFWLVPKETNPEARAKAECQLIREGKKLLDELSAMERGRNTKRFKRRRFYY
ncbi:ribonuclease H1 [Fusarium pseudoanthophilum]|uniref:Ribonuclease H1 n=1 Tax=Fusarium pseudoanthophilum TaxID=48495 RepID=A0A8H5KMD8_9HYPO|nr:ribonuclease H1 [Fusarium pseudoanthophilum]